MIEETIELMRGSAHTTACSVAVIDELAASVTPEVVEVLPTDVVDSFDAAIDAVVTAYGRLQAALHGGEEEENPGVAVTEFGARLAAELVEKLGGGTDEAMNAWERSEQMLEAIGVTYDEVDRQALVSILGAAYLFGKVEAGDGRPFVIRPRTRRGDRH